MTIVQKGIRVKLYPTEEQKVLINKTIGCCRFVHNKTLENCKQSYEQTQQIDKCKDDIERYKKWILETEETLKKLEEDEELS